ncbi:MAG: caspase family protein [Pseudomonadota bacterium]
MRWILVSVLLLLPLPAIAAEKIALVIGMGKYERVVSLDNTVNDARGVSETLAGIGFQVTTLLDATGADFRAAIDEFAFRSETADLALIYYAGHGVEVQGENFLIPVDANITSNLDVQRQAVSLKDLLASVDNARKMRIVILDSCRNDPFGGALENTASEPGQSTTGTRGTGVGGLAPATPDRGTLVAYAAKDGAVALDGLGSNSPFALALMKNLPQPGLEISLMFRQVRDDVLTATGNLQEPHTYGSLSGTPFYLAGTTDGGSVVENANLKVAWSDIRPDQETQLAALAEQGDTRSMVGLAYMRLNSDDPRYEPDQAAKLLIRAAEAGSAEAQFELAQLYEIGLGVPQSIPRALELYQAAAAQNFPDALNDLGFFYFQGEMGVARDPEKGLKYFERAADLRQPQAMFNFASMIDDGNIPGKGAAEAGEYLYRSLRSGSQEVHDLLIERPTMFKLETRKALQARLAENGFYAGTLDGSFGKATQSAITAAFGQAG